MNLIRSLILSTSLVGAATAALLSLGGQSAHAGGGCRGTPVTEASQTTVAIEGSCFSPTIVRVDLGSTVTWENPRDGLPHTITGANTSWGDYGEISPGVSNSYRFDNEGVYPYFCFLHPGMIGAVVVTDGVGGDAPEGANAESVSLAGRALLPQSSATVTSSSEGGFDSLWLIVPLSAVAAIVTAGAGYVLGRRRAKAL